MSITREYAGVRYSIGFLLGDSRLSEEDEEYLFAEALMLDFNNKKSVKLKSDTLEGRVFLSKSFAMIGSFSGRQYDIELDSEKAGSMKLRFIVSELTPGINSKN